ncbi:hypothetical protein BCR44DRAFT_45466 [Catenaria anguillulae PL171]|uniref:Uncharacterized protein n=1 Tax=Catenaria anguillulae PL171 TaxID=765915 RepID=A0A1Y2I425_9FUNG|nr:hypothetical protein BCR44DRAFT_45466 [Catenaria anguillulae PL171]
MAFIHKVLIVAHPTPASVAPSDLTGMPRKAGDFFTWSTYAGNPAGSHRLSSQATIRRMS